MIGGKILEIKVGSGIIFMKNMVWKLMGVEILNAKVVSLLSSTNHVDRSHT